MKKIGLIGESPNDTTAFINLIEPIYNKEASFFILINDLHGSMLDNPKIKPILRKEYESLKPDIVVFIRDLDALESDAVQKEERKNYFTEFNSVVDKKGVFLLNIYELEALILSDISTFNSLYQTSIVLEKDPMHHEEPKEFLIDNTKHPNKYIDSDNPTVFSSLQFAQLKTCKYFASFITEFEKSIKS